MVGIIWHDIVERHEKRQAFIYDVRVDPLFRGQGYGTQTIEELERILQRIGVETVSLHVFGHNTRAQALYLRLGFIPTNIRMTKQVGGHQDGGRQTSSVPTD